MIINWYDGNVITKKEVKNVRHKNVYMLNINEVTYYTCGLGNNTHNDQIMFVELSRNKVWYNTEVYVGDPDDDYSDWDDYVWRSVPFTEEELKGTVFAKDEYELKTLISNTTSLKTVLTRFLESEDDCYKLVTVSCLFPDRFDKLKNSGFYKDYTFYDIDNNLQVGDCVETSDVGLYNTRSIKGYVKSISTVKISPKANKMFCYDFIYRPVKKIDVVQFNKYKNVILNKFEFLPKQNYPRDEIITYVYMLGNTWKAHNIEKFIELANRVARAFDTQSKEYDDIATFANYENIKFEGDNARVDFIKYALTTYYNIATIGKDFKYMEMNI